MNSVYANNFSITTTDGGEVFLSCNMDIPKFDEDGNKVGTSRENGVTIVMNVGVLESLKEMLNNLKGVEL